MRERLGIVTEVFFNSKTYRGRVCELLVELLWNGVLV